MVHHIVSRMDTQSVRLTRTSLISNSSGVKWVVHIKHQHVPVSTDTIEDVYVHYPTKIYRQILRNYGGWYGNVIQPTRTIVYSHSALEMIVLKHIYVSGCIVHLPLLLQLDDNPPP